MAASSRRSRYVRAATSGLPVLGPRQLVVLTWLSQMPVLSSAQLAALCQCSLKALLRLMRPLFDAGLVDVLAVPRAVFAEADEPNDASLLFGSAKNIYRLSSAGVALLVASGHLAAKKRAVSLGPKNAWFLQHQLACADLRVWVEQLARVIPGASLCFFKTGAEAAIALASASSPKSLYPDAAFGLVLGERVLVALCEMDLATEGPLRWRDKLAAYARAFSGDRLKRALGYQRGRLLIITMPKRLERLVQIVQEQAAPPLLAHVWIADAAVLNQPDPAKQQWYRPGKGGFSSLV